ncbi:hypothetical protein CYMTET_6040 [Cymbomonas tetramitiformis]|uniref:PiggyBac transposable element-derived protein domain-containing protein n=1 Tax=Cymbomonas tetramitiformis TaxID=36881 RepID=A0AAE0GXW9_9CHLO|nr:hypothetical protein CYMTET_51210 [Cymbomonas tetramitiformis]KAK3241001.1 hypothetical protein CYMTET_49202 [Cymbomonas tetramitiformis]KAK3286405.1 hypothetical protein CYMTET_6040 [Cymbomonas tetramitiformis]
MELLGKGKEFYADSWFGSVKAAVLLLERGNYLKALVKTNTKFYPLAALKGLAENVDISTHSTRAVSLVTDVMLDTGRRRIFAVYHKGPAQSVLPMIASCGTTLPGDVRVYDAHQKLSTGERRITQRECKQPEVACDYRKRFHVVDNINQATNQTERLDEAWKTHYWPHRDFAKFVGISKVNACHAWQYFDASANGIPAADRNRHFTEGFLCELFNNPFLKPTDMRKGAELEESGVPTRLSPSSELVRDLFVSPAPTARGSEQGGQLALVSAAEATTLAAGSEEVEAPAVCFLTGIPGGHAQKCTVPECKAQCYSVCGRCHTPNRHAWLCGAKTHRDCFQKHVARVAEAGKNFTPKRKRVANLVNKAEELKRAKARAERSVEEANLAAEQARAAAEALRDLMEES